MHPETLNFSFASSSTGIMNRPDQPVTHMLQQPGPGVGLGWDTLSLPAGRYHQVSLCGNQGGKEDVLV